MKKQILIAGLLVVSAITFGQKKEIKSAQKAIKSAEFTEAIATLNGVEGLIPNADSNLQELYYLIFLFFFFVNFTRIISFFI